MEYGLTAKYQKIFKITKSDIAEIDSNTEVIVADNKTLSADLFRWEVSYTTIEHLRTVIGVNICTRLCFVAIGVNQNVIKRYGGMIDFLDYLVAATVGENGYSGTQIRDYFKAANRPSRLTKTHGARSVAYLNHAVEGLLYESRWYIEPRSIFQPEASRALNCDIVLNPPEFAGYHPYEIFRFCMDELLGVDSSECPPAIITFRVFIDGLRKQIWRKFEIANTSTLGDLAYTIMATFNACGSHLYCFYINNDQYSCNIGLDEHNPIERPHQTELTKLSSLDLEKGKQFKMEYDFGSTTNFTIVVSNVRRPSTDDWPTQPEILAGAGAGMVEDVPDFILQDMVSALEKGDRLPREIRETLEFASEYYGKNGNFDFFHYDLAGDNESLDDIIKRLKYGYEKGC